MRRLAPRHLSAALADVVPDTRPATLLARVQEAWPEVAGAAFAAAAAPVAEHEGVVTVACESGLWAQELDLLQRDVLERLADRLGDPGDPPVRRLRPVVGSAPNGPAGAAG